jgi:orotidine-5'-phosphate decarboxylase
VQDNDLRGCLLLAELSCKPNLITADYTQQSVSMANACPHFVTGFIASKRLVMGEEGGKYLWMTPGVALHDGSDGMGQVWRGAHSVVHDGKSDVIIVGRAIYKDDRSQWSAKAHEFQQAGWNAYCARIKP